MNELTNLNDRRMTLKEISEKTGAAYRTVADYARKAGWTNNGRRTLLDERQVTLILEAMKAPVSSGHKSNLAVQLQGIETSQSRVLKLQTLQRQMQDIYEAEIADLKAENEAVKGNLRATQYLLSERETGLAAIQRIAEAGGLMMSDRDDLLAAYGRREGGEAF